MPLEFAQWGMARPSLAEMAVEAARIAREGQRHGIAPAICHQFAADAKSLGRIAPFEGMSRTQYILRRGVSRYGVGLAIALDGLLLARAVAEGAGALANIFPLLAGVAMVCVAIGAQIASWNWGWVLIEVNSAQPFLDRRNALATLLARAPEGVRYRVEPAPSGGWQLVPLPEPSAT